MAKRKKIQYCELDKDCPGDSDEAFDEIDNGGGVWYAWLCDRCRADFDDEYEVPISGQMTAGDLGM